METRNTKSCSVKERKLCKKEEKPTYLEICANQNDESESDECEIKSQSNCKQPAPKCSKEVVACCKPGCSLRMPCVACTKNGCRAVNPSKNKNDLKDSCDSGKPNENTRPKTRARSETRKARTRAISCCRPIPETCQEEKIKKKKKKTTTKDRCKSTSSLKISCSQVTIDTAVLCCGPAKSPCRKLKPCPCECCKNVKFNEECEVISNKASEESSCVDYRNKDSRNETKKKKKNRLSCTNPRSSSPSSFSKSFGITEQLEDSQPRCDCALCHQKSRTNGEAQDHDNKLDEKSFNYEMPSMLPPTYVIPQDFGSNKWSNEKSCSCIQCANKTNCSTYQNSYPPPLLRPF